MKISVLVMGVLYILCNHIAYAQQTKPIDIGAKSSIDLSYVHIDKTSLYSFDTVFQSISRQSHTTILAEGIPLHPKLTDVQVEDLNRALLANHSGSIAEVVERVAGAFDYDVERQDDRTFLLRKRYSDPADLPCVTFGEIIHTLQSVDRILAPYDSDPSLNQTKSMVAFFDSLTPDQQVAAKKGIAIKDLSGDQRNLAQIAITQIVLGQKNRTSHEFLLQLLKLDDRRTEFRWMQVAGVTAFGYVGPFGPQEIIWKIPLTNGFTSQVGRGAILRRPKNPLDSAPVSDFTVPTEEDRRLAEGMMAGRLPSTFTLAEAVRQEISTTSAGLTVTVDRAVADKPVCVFGRENIPQRKMVRSLTVLYGLKLLAPDDNHYTITLPTPRVTKQIGEVAAEVRRVIPLPLSRSSLGQTATAMNMLQAHAPKVRPPSVLPVNKEIQKGREEFQSKKDHDQAFASAVNAYYYPAIRRLLLLTLPAVPTEQSAPVPIIELKPEVKRLIAIGRLSGNPLQELTALANLEVPASISNIEDVHVRLEKTGALLMMEIGNGENDGTGKEHSQLSNIVMVPNSGPSSSDTFPRVSPVPHP